MNNSITKDSYIECPQCQGSGWEERRHCSFCRGAGLGIFHERRFLYWGPKLSTAIIGLRRLKKKFDLFVNLFSLFIGLLGVLALAWWFWQSSEAVFQSGDYKQLMFWRFQSPWLLFFWITVLFDMFVVYRLSQQQKKDDRLKKRKKHYSAQNSQAFDNLPDNWSELNIYKYKVDVSGGFGDETLFLLENAYLMALKQKNEKVRACHLFFNLLFDKEVSAFFVRVGANVPDLMKKLQNQIKALPTVNGNEILDLEIEIKEALMEAYIDAYEKGQKKAKAINIILPLVSKNKILKDILYELEIDEDKIFNATQWFYINDKLMKKYQQHKKMARFKPNTIMDRAYTAVATPILNHYAYDITKSAKWGRLPLCVSREQELEEIFTTWESGQKGIILVGETGVGKRTIVNGLADLMVEEMVPSFLQDKRLLELDIARLVSGTNPSQAEERLLVMIDEVARAGNIILFINNLENLIGISSGEENSLELSEVLANALEKNYLYCLASATNENYNKYIKNVAIGNVMNKVEILEAKTNQAIQILESKVGYLENKFKIYFSYDAIAESVKLSDKYMHDAYLPSKAIKILENTAAKVSKRCQSDKKACLVLKNDVAQTISELVKIPLSKITEDEGEKLLNLETEMHKRLIGQGEAVKMVADSLRRARSGLNNDQRPIATFLFMGPTGVGKTELAKTVAEVYFGQEDLMIRLDMSEYQNQDSLSKMIGDGDNPGYLTEAVQKQPFALILLDEFEKAHPNILNLFLQVFDDGRLTDGQGRTVDFSNTIIVTTSNVGAHYIEEQLRLNINTDLEHLKEVLINEYLNQVIRPELINRFDGIIVFKPLNQEELIEICQLLLKDMEQKLAEKGVSLQVSPEALGKISQEAYDPKFGARPLRRFLQDKIENDIAKLLLAGTVKRRDTIIIDANGNIQIKKAEEL